MHGAALWEQEGGAGQQRLKERHEAGEENQVKKEELVRDKRREKRERRCGNNGGKHS